MKLTLLTVGKCRQAGYRMAAQEYGRRLAHYAVFSEIHIRDERGTLPVEEVLRKEGRRLLEAIPHQAYVIALDRSGNTCSSEALAKRLSDLAPRGHLAFIIGGAFGLSEEVRGRADWVLSLSPMTFPHELARVLLLEQLYRASTILRGEGYHK